MSHEDRIDELLSQLASQWKKYPSLRLGQLIANAISPDGDLQNLYGIKDDKLIEKVNLQQYVVLHKIADAATFPPALPSVKTEIHSCQTT